MFPFNSASDFQEGSLNNIWSGHVIQKENKSS